MFFKSIIKKLINSSMEFISLFDELYYYHLVRNISTNNKKFKSFLDKIGIDFLGSYDGDNISYYYLVEDLPHSLSIFFKDKIRSECDIGIKVNFINKLESHFIDWDSSSMKSRLNILKEVGEEKNNADINPYNLYENIESMNRKKWIEESLKYLAIADRERGRGILKSSMLITISGTKGDVFDTNVKKIEKSIKQLGIKSKRVLYEIPDLLRYFSPFSCSYIKSIHDYIPVQILTDEIVSRYSTFSQGKLGINGICFGMDIISKFPVIKMPKQKTDAAENWLITSETGGGKSLIFKILLLQLLGLTERKFRATIMDIEGFEYIPLANFLSHKSKVIIINMAEGSGKYFDSMEIPPKLGIEDIDAGAKNLSFNFTLSKFKVLLGEEFKKDMWLDVMLNDAIASVYEEAGVIDEDDSTWHQNSKGLSIFDVYNKIKSMQKEIENNDYKNAIDKALAITGRYFEKTGSRAGLFKERILIEDIIDADLVICSFGMAGKSPEMIDDIQLNLMLLGAAQLSQQRSIYSKAQGYFNVKGWEESQRWGNVPGAKDTIGVAITGGRKIGDINVILTNVPGDLLDNDTFGLMGNITSFLVGALKDSKVIEDLCERLQVPELANDLAKISMTKRDSDSRLGEDSDENEDSNDDLYKNAFLCGLDSSKFTVVKMMLPESLIESNIFKTGVDLNS
ncbi:TPA: hypothetical protein KPJ62_002675 [Clostridioides difficile]|nr:hypothetical protein [Clostridioides difficile]